ncbi:HypC/HybG/HupF family hydrogenase formation chaperone [Acidianus manzaensis]|uniref:Hydrogenase accessory protein n=1 Tax=Acidianus manzaensis TaxID=282676 RepID=A0A1W6JYP0_9CREN|nr:HypC/HybG/HupF family hydrogenase formation chaperone [Acidianus manzaensis]ARM75352.1 hydrogenase accessory protein [Acidianus manzaensis]
MSEYDPYDMALIGKIIKIEKNTALVDFNGIKRDIELGLVEAKEGDYILVHAGYAIKVIDEKDMTDNIRKIINKLNE